MFSMERACIKGKGMFVGKGHALSLRFIFQLGFG